MLPFISRSMVIEDPDPYDACYYGVSEHPRYHDCHNCEHAKRGTCDYGDGVLKSAELKKCLAICNEMLAAYPKRDPKRLPP